MCGKNAYDPPSSLKTASGITVTLPSALPLPLSGTPDFSRRIILWQAQSGRRGLPWQKMGDPYPIWLSEIMLQQTQVATVIDYFVRFQERFPTLFALANAPLEEVLSLWAGLGYYARARNLHKCARQLVLEREGRFPGTSAQLAQLPGIGRSTAAAIAAFAYGERAAILDGNVKRVLCRHFAVKEAPVGKAEKSLWSLAQSLLPPEPASHADISAYTQGIMDLGATLCLARNPKCGACPLRETCLAHQQGIMEELPTPKISRAGKKPEKSREAVFMLITDKRHILLERRPPFGIWGGLLSVPEGLSCLPRLGLGAAALKKLPERKHAFTHFTLTILPMLCHVEHMPSLTGEPGLETLPLARALNAGVPAPVARLLKELMAQFSSA